MTITELLNISHSIATAHGWWDKPRPEAEVLINIIGEVAELWEAYRAGNLSKPCDKPIPLSYLEEELADIIIRTADYAAAKGIDLDYAIRVKLAYNKTRPYRHGNKKA